MVTVRNRELNQDIIGDSLQYSISQSKVSVFIKDVGIEQVEFCVESSSTTMTSTKLLVGYRRCVYLYNPRMYE